MTGLLNDLMTERADALDPPTFDLEAVTRAADRRVSRRRTAIAGLGAAAALTAALALPVALSHDAPQALDAPGGLFAEQPVTWALGSTLHVGDRSLDLGRPVQAFVPTPVGVVFADPEGVVWSTTGGDPVEVGRINADVPRLRVDEGLVAWVEPGSATSPPVVAAFDQPSGEVARDALANTAGMGATADSVDPAVVYAVDAGTVYVRDPRGAVAWQPATGEQRVLDSEADGFTIDDVQAGQIAHSYESGQKTVHVVGPDAGPEGSPIPAWSGYALSPDARYLLGEDDLDMAKVFEVATGEVIDASVPGYAFFGGFAWLDHDTYLGIGLNQPWESTPIDLLTCDVGGGCEVAAAAVGTISGGLVLPTGEATDR